MKVYGSLEKGGTCVLQSYINKIFIVIILAISIALSMPYYRRAVEASTIDHSRDGWEVSLPELQGVDQGFLLNADKFISKTDAVSMIIVRHESIIFEKYYRGQLPADLCFAYPTANSLLSALTGIALRNGIIKVLIRKYQSFFLIMPY